jgi:hypothetical protein
MKAYVVVEGATDAALVRAVLPPDLQKEVAITVAGERSNPTSIARTLLVTRRKPVAILVDTDSVDERRIQERAQIIQELIQAAAAGVPTRVILFIPHSEAVFFQAQGLLSRLFGEPLPEDVRLLAGTSPKEALERLFAQGRGPRDLHALLDGLDDAGKEALRATWPARELLTFLQEVTKPHAKQARA